MDHIAASATKYAIRITEIEKELELAKFERDTLAEVLRGFMSIYGSYSRAEKHASIDCPCYHCKAIKTLSLISDRK